MNPTESDSLFIEALELECIVGIRPAERRRPQRVRVDVRMMLDLARAGRSGRFGHTVDYSLVVEEISRLLHFREYRLVEMATEEIAGMLFAAHPLHDFGKPARVRCILVCREFRNPIGPAFGGRSFRRNQGFDSGRVRIAGAPVSEGEQVAIDFDSV